MSQLDTWVNLATASLAGVDDAVLREELRWTLDEFFQKSQVWQDTLPSFTVLGGTAETDINTILNAGPATNNLAASEITQVFVGDKSIPPVRDVGSAPDTNDVADNITFFATELPGVIRWVPIPLNDTEDVVARAVLYCTDYESSTGTQIPSFIIRQYKDIVLHGLYGRMLSHDNKPYSNANKGLFYLKQFRSECIKLQDIAQRGFNNSERMWLYNTGYIRGRW